MKAPLSWLKDYVDIDCDVATLCKKLVGIGFEVENVVYMGENLNNVVVGKIEEIDKHPNADRLRICQVNVGNQILQIVTGATNVQEGDVVPVALDNSDLPCGKHIVNGQLRGVDSCGMLCGGEELGVTEDVYPGASVDGILILNKDEQLGVDIKKVLGYDDYVLDISITANRPDCNSVYGIAREVAVALGKKCKPIDCSYNVDGKGNVNDYVNVEVKDKILCPTYYMSVVTDTVIKTSPIWLTRRLHACGLRGINTLVDITNYILLEMGQPMHAFDYADLSDKTIIVRRAENGEKITLLDEKEYILDNEVLVIADKSKAVGLAGIMGGANSEIKSTTANVAFECAKFKRENIRHNSRRLKVRSDSSARYEKGVDSYTTSLALGRALHLVNELNCGKVVEGRISIDEPTEQTIIKFPYNNIEKILGIVIPQSDCEKILNNLHVDTTICDGVVKCIVPKYREDIERECDIIEEIVRVYGYDNMQPTLLDKCQITNGGKSINRIVTDRTKRILVGRGYNEIITYSFGGKAMFGRATLENNVDTKNYINILNPLGEEFSLMRTSLLPTMLDIVASNQAKSNINFKLFEIAVAYLSDKTPLTDMPKEKSILSMATSQYDFYTLKADIADMLSALNIRIDVVRSTESILHPGISADIITNGIKIGYFGKLHPTIEQQCQIQDVCVAQIDFEKVIELHTFETKFVSIPKFPAIDRDFALVCDDKIMARELIDLIKQACPLCESVNVFDVYRGNQIEQGKKSVALNVKFRGDKTLKDSDIDPQIEKCLKELKEKLGATLR